MGTWSGPFLIAASLLAAAGIAKMVDPTMTVGALRGIGLRMPALGVRILGALEAALAIGAAATGTAALALGVAASYLAFTFFVIVAQARRLPIGTCGCFGKVDTPPSWIHVGVNLAAAASAIAVASNDGNGISTTLHAQPLAGIPFLALIAVGTYAAFTALTIVPQLMRGAKS